MLRAMLDWLGFGEKGHAVGHGHGHGPDRATRLKMHFPCMFSAERARARAGTPARGTALRIVRTHA